MLDANKKVVASGTTVPFGADQASGDKVSIIDFSNFTTEGKGYSLQVGNDTSHSFDIRNDIYNKLKYDSLAFFYQQRSGIPIEMPYAGGPDGFVRPGTSTLRPTTATRTCAAPRATTAATRWT